MESRTNENDACFNLLGEELDIGPVISQDVCKVLDECIRSMSASFPSSPKLKDKDRVRRPMNAFMIYSKNARKAMAKYYPTLSYRKLSKALGKIWKVLDPAEKKPFIEEAERLRILHKKEHPDFKFTSYKKRKPKVNDPKKTDEKSLPNVQDLFDLIQCEHLSQKLGKFTEDIGCDHKSSLFNVGAESKNILDTASYDTLLPNQSLFASDSSFQIEPTPTWTAFGAHDESVPSPTGDFTFESDNDQELLSILQSILNDAPTSVGLNPSTSTQFPPLQCSTPLVHNPNALPVGQVTKNNELLTSLWNDCRTSPYLTDPSSFPFL